jgi:hypothetical protein
MIWIDGGAAVQDISSHNGRSVSEIQYQHLLTKALESQCVARARSRLAGLNGLPDAPTADIFDFIARKILDIVPLEYRNSDRSTQIIYVKNFAETNIADVEAAGDGMRGCEWANDGYTLGQHSEVNEISLGMLRQFFGEWGRQSHVCHDIIG